MTLLIFPAWIDTLLNFEEGMTVTDIAKTNKRNWANTQVIFKELLRNEFFTMHIYKQNKRKRHYFLTDKGYKLIKNLKEVNDLITIKNGGL